MTTQKIPLQSDTIAAAAQLFEMEIPKGATLAQIGAAFDQEVDNRQKAATRAFLLDKIDKVYVDGISKLNNGDFDEGGVTAFFAYLAQVTEEKPVEKETVEDDEPEEEEIEDDSEIEEEPEEVMDAEIEPGEDNNI